MLAFLLLQYIDRISIQRDANRFLRLALVGMNPCHASIQIDLDDDGKMCGAHIEESTESHQMIEEFMLAANEAVAVKLHDMELNFLRRIHESPEVRKLKLLTDFVLYPSYGTVQLSIDAMDNGSVELF